METEYERVSCQLPTPPVIKDFLRIKSCVVGQAGGDGDMPKGYPPKLSTSSNSCFLAAWTCIYTRIVYTDRAADGTSKGKPCDYTKFHHNN
jgi:hypothetical protein